MSTSALQLPKLEFQIRGLWSCSMFLAWSICQCHFHVPRQTIRNVQRLLLHFIIGKRILVPPLDWNKLENAMISRNAFSAAKKWYFAFSLLLGVMIYMLAYQRSLQLYMDLLSYRNIVRMFTLIETCLLHPSFSFHAQNEKWRKTDVARKVSCI